MAALVEGLAGVKDGPKSQAYAHPRLSPRWDLTTTAAVKTIVRYAASKGYVAYTYTHNPATREILLSVTGSGDAIDCHLLLPTAPAPTLTVRTGRDNHCLSVEHDWRRLLRRFLPRHCHSADLAHSLLNRPR